MNDIKVYLDNILMWESFSNNDYNRFFNFASKPTYNMISTIKIFNETVNKYIEVVFITGAKKVYNNINGVLVEV